MKDKRILSLILAKKQEIKIIVLYVVLLSGIVTTSYIYNIYKHHQLTFQGAERTVLPIPNVDFLLSPPSKTFELSFFRFHDINAASQFVKIYLHLKLRSHTETKKHITMKFKISIMRSGWNRGYGGSELENESLTTNFECTNTCNPQMIYDYKISPYYSDYMIAIEVLNVIELYNQEIEAFTTGVVTANSGFAIRAFLIQIACYIISIITFLFTILSLENARDPLYLRIFALCGLFVNSQGYLLYPGRIRILIKEIVLTIHTTLLTNLWFYSIENLISKKYYKVKIFILSIIAISALIVYHVLWDLPITLSTCLLGILSIFILITNFQKVRQSLWKDRAISLTTSTYLISYLFILIKGNFNFLDNGEFNILFNMISSLFTMSLAILNSLDQDKPFNAIANSSPKGYNVVDVKVVNQSK